MSEAYIPYAPLDTLKPIADDVWVVDGPEIRMGYLGMKIPFSTRMTIVRFPDGAIWIHSPIAFDETLANEVEKLRRIAFIVAPNTLHYWYAPEWKGRLENFEPKRVKSQFWRFMMRLFGAADPDGKAPFDMQMTFWRHRAAIRRAAQQMIDWNPERIIAHGRWYEANGAAELRRAFRWVL